MARFNIKTRGELDEGLILAPERYDPRRDLLGDGGDSICIGDLAASHRDTLNPATCNDASGTYLVLDTGDAAEGLVTARRPPVELSGVGSTKKRVPAGSVIISRLRPYLRQVALVDAALPGSGDGVQILCSTEFFVLIANDGQSLAFLVPYLLSASVQAVLAAAQEGGHHPRVSEATLLELPVPVELVRNRQVTSTAIEKAISAQRDASATVASLIRQVDQELGASGEGGAGERMRGSPPPSQADERHR